jgi:hypothetical protein
MNKEELKDFVLNNSTLVTRKESVNYPGLYVIKYSRKVFYDALWNDILEECRGLVVDEDWNVVIHPFTKIYNHGERDTTFDLDEDVTVVRKVNGFMAAVTIVNGEPVVSTTGSLDSDFVQYAKDKLGDLERFKGNRYPYNPFTWIFEIVHEEDPHIVPEKAGAYLIGMRDLAGVVLAGPMLRENILDSWARDLGVLRPEWVKCKFEEAVAMAKAAKHEGFVVRRDSDDATLKIKSPYYLTTKFFARVNAKRLLEKFGNDQAMKQIVVEEEFFPLVEYVCTHKEKFVIMEEQERINFIRDFLNGTV